MISKKIILILFVLSSLMSTAGSFYFFSFPLNIFAAKAAFLISPKEKIYEKQWQKVDSLTNKGLTQSALKVVEEIYTTAKSDNNAPQIVKAIIHRIKLESYMEEYSLQKAIHKMKEEIKDSKYPLRPVLHSMLAELYWRYYQDNRWKFQNRTQTVNFKVDDIAAWDLNTLVDQVVKQYQLSLQDVDALKHTSLNMYDDVITRDDFHLKEKPMTTRKFRTSLYDFLAHRAIDFYINEEPDLIKPAYKFELHSESYFWDYDAFAKLKIENKDSLSLKFYGIKLLQDLISFHNNPSDAEALIDVDLKRLKFVRNTSILEGKDSLYLHTLQNLEKKFIQNSASAEISFEIAEIHNERSGKYQPFVSDENKWEKKTALSICKDAIKRFPGSYGANNCKYLASLIETKSLAFNVEAGNLPNAPFRARVQYTNLHKIYVRIIKQEAHKFSKDIEDYYGEKLIKKFLQSEVVKEWTVDLPDDGDYQSHSVEIKIPELPLGHYVLLAGSDKSFSYEKNGVGYANCFVTELCYAQRRTENGGYDFTVLHREKGYPMKNVNVQLWQQQYNYAARKCEYSKGDRFITDDQGGFHVPPSADKYSNYYVELTSGNDTLYSDNGMYIHIHYKTEKRAYLKTFFFTDRAIYRPGQTVYFKGILLETDGETNQIKPNENVNVVLYDANNQNAASLNLTSNDYGTYNGTFTLPQNGMNGQMRIADGHGDVYFSVEDYKRPKFEINFNPIKGVYKLNENVEVKGKAQSHAGANIDGAEVKYRVVRNAAFPYYSYGWRGVYPSSPQMEITNGITATNDTGGFVINFKAIPDLSIKKSHAPLYTYTIYSDVTDITGETHSNQSDVSVGYNAMKMDVDIKKNVSKDSVPKFNIITTNLNGEFEPAKVKVQIWKQKEPDRLFRKRLWEQADKHLMTKEDYYTNFPNDVYADEDNQYKWEKMQQVFTGDFDTEQNKDELSLPTITQWQIGAYIMEASAKDMFGETVKDVKYFTVYSSDENVLPVNEFDWFLPLKIKGEPGDNASFLIGTKASDTKILLEIEHKNEIVKTEWLTLNNEQKKIEIPIEEKHRGNFAYHLLFVKSGRAYSHDGAITVPYTNKELDIQFETFRSKLIPGQKEEWKIKIKNSPLLRGAGGGAGDKIASEMLAAMYDASLDAFRPNNWYFNIYNSYYASHSWEIYAVAKNNYSSIFFKKWNIYPPLKYKYHDRLNWFGYNIGNGYTRHADYTQKEDADALMLSAPPMRKESMIENNVQNDETINYSKPLMDAEAKTEGFSASYGDKSEGALEKISLQNITARKILEETAFFFPALQSDENGNVIIKFTIPEALTKWKMLGFAHTKDLKYGQIEKEVVTQKELMVTPHAPRFFREGDNITFTAKVDNLSSADMNGTAQLFLYDAVTMKEGVGWLSPSGGDEGGGLRNFIVKKGQSAPLKWDLTIPEKIGAITYKVVAKAGNFTDGEESAVPVLTNRMLVTESMPLPIHSKQTKTFRFEKFISQNNASSTLKNHKLTLEFSSNPAWYAVQSLPYMMESSYTCSEQIFSRFYANSLASHMANSSPKIKAVFDSWKNSSDQRGGASLLSTLDKNQELKSLILEETPWVLDAKDESERKKRVGLLFDLNKMANERESSLNKLQKMQASNGGWPWFEGMPDDRYITQHIVTGMGHLDNLSVKNIREDSKTWNMVLRAVRYLDDRIREDYEWILKQDKENIDKDHIRQIQIQYLYARSYFWDIKIEHRNQKAFDYYKEQAQKYWLSKGRYMGGMIALGLFRYGEKKVPVDILKSLKENALVNEEMGMYWKENYEGFYWYEAPIESHSLLVEAFDEVANDKKAVDDLRTWLLKSKQTQNWKSTKATTEAVYALLLRGTDWLATESKVEISLGDIKINPKNLPDTKAEAGTGYFKTSWNGNDIKPNMGNITVEKKDEGVSWGSLYWQYFEQLDKITSHQTPLHVLKNLFIEKNTGSGPVIEPITENTNLKPGDKLKVRIELRVDRDMEYVHMKDMRASGFEPVTVFSQYKYQDGLGYYENFRDASANFFFSHLPKGAYIFEYPLIVSHSGDFSNGITSIQCMYAPEFASHSEGIRIKVEK